VFDQPKDGDCAHDERESCVTWPRKCVANGVARKQSENAYVNERFGLPGVQSDAPYKGQV
jgi:hypothetical protein